MNLAAKTEQAPVSEARKKAYRLLGIAKKQLADVRPGFTDEDYRHILFMHGAKEKDGTFSASTMSLAQLNSALKHCQDLGFRISKKVLKESSRLNQVRPQERDWRKARVGKLNALWISLADAGVIDNRSEEAMKSYCVRRVKGLTRFEWITSEQLNKAIEMLKQMHIQRGLKLH